MYAGRGEGGSARTPDWYFIIQSLKFDNVPIILKVCFRDPPPPRCGIAVLSLGEATHMVGQAC